MLSSPFERISASDVLFVAGGDPTTLTPVLGLQVRMASRLGASLIALGHMPGLRRFTSMPLICPPPAETAVLAALAQHLRKKSRHAAIDRAVEGVLDTLPPLSLEDAAKVAGISGDRLSAAAEALAGSHDASVIIGPHLAQRAEGHWNIALAGCIARLLEARTYLMAGLANERGVLDMGCRPDTLPGGVPLAVDANRRDYEDLLGRTVPGERGLHLMEMIEAAHSRSLRALYVTGEDLFSLLPDRAYVKEALSRLDLLVVHESFLTETALQADAVLPAPFWMEQEGSYTNLEGRMQGMRKALTGPGKEVWRLMEELSAFFGQQPAHTRLGDVLAEITSASPLHRNLTVDLIDAGCTWPYASRQPQGNECGEGASIPFSSPDFVSRSEGGPEKIHAMVEAPLLGLSHGSHFSAVLKSVAPEPFVRLGTALAHRLSVADGDELSLSGEGGTIRLRAVTDADFPDGVVTIPLASEKGGLASLVKWTINPITKTPAFDSAAIAIGKAGSREGNHAER
jgi:predicted molibdopterin-dependent oxidoreductase YjgC